MIEIRTVETERELDRLHEFAKTNYDPEFQCSAGIPYASRRALTYHLSEHYVIAAEVKGELLGWAVYEESGRMRWMVALPARWGEVIASLIDHIKSDAGRAYGRTSKTETAARLKAVHPALFDRGDGMVEW